MKKNYFLSLTTLMAVVALLFASCQKDFGDDIARVDNKVDGIKTTVEKLEGAVDKIKTDTQASIKAETDKLQASIKELNESLKTKEEALKSADEATKKELTAEIAKLKKEVEASYATLKALEEYKAEVDKKLEGFDAKIAEAKKASEAKQKELEEKLAADVKAFKTEVETKLTELYKANGLLSRRLTSIVAISEYNYNGLPALYVPTIATVAGDCGNLQKVDGYVIEYHLNPSHISAADVDLASAAFTGNSVAKLRAASTQEFAKAYVTAMGAKATIADGVLSIPVSVDHKALVKDGYVDGRDKFVQVALQLPFSEEVRQEFPENTVVTSDYVAIYGKTLKGWVDLKLARNAQEGVSAVHYLAQTEAEAKAQGVKGVASAVGAPVATATDPRVISLPFGGSIDLNEYVRTMFLEGSKATDFKIEEYGLTYAFDLLDADGKAIEYTLNNEPDNPTNQQNFIVIDENGVAKAKNHTTSDNIAAQGRTPIVRVRLVKGDCVVMVAFLKLHLEPKADKEPVAVHFDFTAEDPFVLNCDNNKVLTYKVSVKDINEKLYPAVGLSASQFKNAYPQSIMTVLEPSKSIGNVWVNTPEPMGQGTRTEVLKWTFTQEEAWSVLIGSTKTTTDVDIKVVFTPTDTKKYPVLTVTMKGRVTREGFDVLNLAKADLSEGAWVNGSPVMNVTPPTPATGPYTNTPEFKYDLRRYFKTENVGGQLLPVFGKKIDHAYFFEFADLGDNNSVTVNGKKYVFTTYREYDNATGDIVASHLLINGEEAMKLSGDNLANFTLDNTVTPLQELLHSEAVGGLFAYVQIITDRCKDDERLNVVTVLEKDMFKINFQRPVVMEVKNDKTLKDGVNEGEVGSFVSIKGLLELIEWRTTATGTTPRKFSADQHLWAYYGVTAVEADLDKAVTNYQYVTTAPETFESVRNTPVQLGFKSREATDVITGTLFNPGRITYKNGGTEVKNFQIKVPVKVTYKFGVLEDVVTITVNKTTVAN